MTVTDFPCPVPEVETHASVFMTTLRREACARLLAEASAQGAGPSSSWHSLLAHHGRSSASLDMLLSTLVGAWDYPRAHLVPPHEGTWCNEASRVGPPWSPEVLALEIEIAFVCSGPTKQDPVASALNDKRANRFPRMLATLAGASAPPPGEIMRLWQDQPWRWPELSFLLCRDEAPLDDRWLAPMYSAGDLSEREFQYLDALLWECNDKPRLDSLRDARPNSVTPLQTVAGSAFRELDDQLCETAGARSSATLHDIEVPPQSPEYTYWNEVAGLATGSSAELRSWASRSPTERAWVSIVDACDRVGCDAGDREDAVRNLEGLDAERPDPWLESWLAFARYRHGGDSGLLDKALSIWSDPLYGEGLVHDAPFAAPCARETTVACGNEVPRAVWAPIEAVASSFQDTTTVVLVLDPVSTRRAIAVDDLLRLSDEFPRAHMFLVDPSERVEDFGSLPVELRRNPSYHRDLDLLPGNQFLVWSSGPRWVAALGDAEPAARVAAAVRSANELGSLP